MSAPPKGATTRKGNPAEKVTIPTKPGEFVMTMASQPSATCCIHCPTEAASAPSQSLRNTGCCATAPRKRTCHAGSADSTRRARLNRACGATRCRNATISSSGNACPTTLASAQAGNRVDYTTESDHHSGPQRMVYPTSQDASALLVMVRPAWEGGRSQRELQREVEGTGACWRERLAAA